MIEYTTIRFNAGNDRNGNPRRVYVTFLSGEIVAVYDEGYKGEAAITDKRHKNAFRGYTFTCEVGEYDELIERYSS